MFKRECEVDILWKPKWCAWPRELHSSQFHSLANIVILAYEEWKSQKLLSEDIGCTH